MYTKAVSSLLQLQVITGLILSIILYCIHEQTRRMSIAWNTINFQSLASWVTYNQLQDFFFASHYLAKTNNNKLLYNSYSRQPRWSSRLTVGINHLLSHHYRWLSFTTQTSHMLMMPRVPVVTLSIGLCRSVERLSVSDVDIDDGLSLALAQMTACYAIISETNLHCSHLAALSASFASACAASL